jgi:gentisate 1,2-dioxygenase
MKTLYVERTGSEPPEHSFIEPVVWRKAEIERAIARLRDAPKSAGRRSLRIAHGDTGPEQGVSPGIGVVISVLEPGEADQEHRHTFSVVNFIREGFGHSLIDGQKIEWGPGDIFTTPGWAAHHHQAAADSPPVVRFGFTDAPLHEKLGVSFYAAGSGNAKEAPPRLSGEALDEAPPAPEGTIIDDNGARLLTYKHMLAPKIVANVPMLWRFAKVKPFLNEMDNGNPEFNGRRVVMLYNPATGVAQGTTSTMTAFVGIIAAGEKHTAHRHTSVAINYWTAGSGCSVVGGKRIEWEAGDMVISPAWAPHGHVNDGDETAWGIVIHDAPLLFNTGALLWQEVLSEDIEVLGRTGALTPAETRG